MSQNKEDLKNKIIYRASYRGTKEMDMIMSAFVRYLFNEIKDNELEALNSFVNMDDEEIKNYMNKESPINIKNQKIIDIINKFKNLIYSGGETGIRTQERAFLCRFSRPVLSTAQPSLHSENFYNY